MLAKYTKALYRTHFYEFFNWNQQNLKTQSQSFTIKIEFYHSINNILLKIIAKFDILYFLKLCSKFYSPSSMSVYKKPCDRGYFSCCSTYFVSTNSELNSITNLTLEPFCIKKRQKKVPTKKLVLEIGDL